MMQGDIEKEIYIILNDEELSDQDKILKIIAYPPSTHTYPTGFVTILDFIKKENSNFVDEHQKIILNFLKNYSSSSTDLDLKKSLFKDKFSEILLDFFSEENPKLLSDKFLTLISSPISQTRVWSDFDPDPDLKNSSQGSIRSSSPPPPPPPRIFSPPPTPPLEISSNLKIPNGSPLPLPIYIGNDPNENIGGVSGIEVTSSRLTDEEGSGEVYQTSSTMIDDQQSQQGDLLPWPQRLSGDAVHQELLPLPQQEGSVNQELLPLPKRLDQDGDQLTQQNINSSPVVFGDQNQVFEVNDLATQNSTEHIEQVTFVLPQKLVSLNSSDASLNIVQGPAVVPMASNPSEPRNDGIPTTNPEEELLDQDPQGKPEKKPSCFSGIFSRVFERAKGLYSKISSCTSLKFPSASCLGSSRSGVGSEAKRGEGLR
jgi:hypothetical protein